MINDECTTLLHRLILSLYTTYAIYPTRWEAMDDCGEWVYFITYRNKIDKIDLLIEVHNDLEMCALLNHDKTIIDSIDFYDIHDEKLKSMIDKMDKLILQNKHK